MLVTTNIWQNAIMGNGSAKPITQIVQNSLELYGDKFAKKYIEYVLKYDVSNLAFISKAYHLVLFIAKDGANKMYDSSMQQYNCIKQDSKNRSIIRVDAQCSIPRDLSDTSDAYYYKRDLQVNKFNQLMVYICFVILNQSYENNHIRVGGTLVNFNVDCYQLNKYVKQHAITELAKQQQNHRDFYSDNIQKYNDEMLQINENMKRNEDRIRDTKQIHTTIQQIIDDNTNLNKRRMVLMDIVRNSEKPENAIKVIDKNVEKLQLLIKILVCEDMVEQQVAFPVVPTHVPVIYPTVPDTLIATVVYAKDVHIATASVV